MHTIHRNVYVYIMVVSRCRGIGPPSGIPSSGLPFYWPPTTSSANAVFLACFYKSIYRHLGNTPPRSTV